MRYVFLTGVLALLGTIASADPVALAAINAERAAQNRAPLVYDATIEQVAQAHAQDMAANGFFSHTGSDGSDIGQRLKRGGYRFCFGAENIASGQRSLTEVMASWMASRGHRRNILHRQAQAVGLAQSPGNIWVMVLAAPC
ncbi:MULTISPECIES: CAP domain-containing protein [Roseobacteraceae]|uniref:CAP domain-containing protein n=1 Tax=Roseobacteraceae TaxID=2854170 RepID=UPI001C45FED6|nr:MULTISPECIES: CAP domain-containing protein [Roseobacteraceae]MBV7408966.1 CAP domain-containing protein [Maritimibacter sp. DP1N21-5]MBY5934347.1 CAP domain-containing protein [Tateyamaria omphalii]